jgi:hypothetical protein
VTEPSWLLTIADGQRPVSADGDVGCVMLVKPSGMDDEFQWFDYLVRFYDETPTRYLWDKGTTLAAFPADVAEFLVKQRYARFMTASEVQAYNAGPEEVKAEPNKEK